MEDTYVERYRWTVVYNDGTAMDQFNPDGTENGYGEIDRDKITEFHMRNEEGTTILAMEITPEQRLIYRKRHSLSAASGERNWTIYLVGWQQTIAGKNVQSLNWIFPNGSIINTGRFQDNHPIFYSIQLLPFEEEEESRRKVEGGTVELAN